MRAYYMLSYATSFCEEVQETVGQSGHWSELEPVSRRRASVVSYPAPPGTTAGTRAHRPVRPAGPDRANEYTYAVAPREPARWQSLRLNCSRLLNSGSLLSRVHFVLITSSRPLGKSMTDCLRPSATTLAASALHDNDKGAILISADHLSLMMTKTMWRGGGFLRYSGRAWLGLPRRSSTTATQLPESCLPLKMDGELLTSSATAMPSLSQQEVVLPRPGECIQALVWLEQTRLVYCCLRALVHNCPYIMVCRHQDDAVRLCYLLFALPVYAVLDLPRCASKQYASPEGEHRRVSCWVPLQPVSTEGGCMQFVPGTTICILLQRQSSRVHAAFVNWQAFVGGSINSELAVLIVCGNN